MKYRLKDKDLQKKLDEISNGEFSKALQNPHSEALLRMPPIETLNVNFGGTIGKGLLQARFTMRLLKDDVEVVPEYNPHGWNKYPEVTPPEGVWMRIECVETDESGTPELIGIRSRYIRSYVTGEFQWTGIDGEWLDDWYKVVRFRPWDE